MLPAIPSPDGASAWLRDFCRENPGELVVAALRGWLVHHYHDRQVVIFRQQIIGSYVRAISMGDD